MNEFLNQLLHNITNVYLLVIIVFVASYIILRIAKKVLVKHFRKLSKVAKIATGNVLADIISNIKSISLLVVSVYIASRFSEFSASLLKVINIVFLTVLVYEGIKVLQKILNFFIYQALKKDADEAQAKKTAKTFNVFIQIILWSFGFLLILSNTGADVNSLLAGLGIGGIAVALAMQNILGDIFASFSILIDRPFQVGDFIKTGTESGVVEKIGIKTTHLKTLDGQTLIIANQELTTTRVENYRQVEKRRSLFTLGIVYETNQESLEKIPKIIKDIVEKYEVAEFDRCHFKSYGDFSLNFEVSFYLEVDDYKSFLDVVEKVNLDIFRAFKEKGIKFAYPTALHYQKNI
ncbi:MAG: mechanosensitive ion channel family protein [Bacteroidales bacterium]|nr:mechanosensitive ion channel family protein [Bacteroidales bacterium]